MSTVNDPKSGLISIAARLARCDLLDRLNEICENQTTISTNKLQQLIGDAENKLKREAIHVRNMALAIKDNPCLVSIKDQLPEPEQGNKVLGFNGVCWLKKRGKWQAQIRVNYKTISLGLHYHKEDAVAARVEANKKYGFHENHGKAGERYGANK